MGQGRVRSADRCVRRDVRRRVYEGRQIDPSLEVDVVDVVGEAKEVAAARCMVRC